MTFIQHVCIGCGKCDRVKSYKPPTREALKQVKRYSRHELSSDVADLLKSGKSNGKFK